MIMSGAILARVVDLTLYVAHAMGKSNQVKVS